MGVKAALVIGFFATLACFVHSGIYAPGQDFIVNRFTGAVRFVPAEDDDSDEASQQIHVARSLTPRRSGARYPRFVAARGACDPTLIGR
jgi:hypothetical protein